CPGFRRLLSNDFNRKTATASATIGIVQHNIPGGTATLAGTSGDSPLQSIQIELRHVIQAGSGEFIVFGSGIISQEFSKIIFDSLILVIPAASLLILFFLIIAYRDPIDLILGLIALVITIIWTFGFLGLAGIAFTQLLIAIPPLLLAVGIDFGIHAVNRYREERTANNQIQAAMKTTVNQLFVAFFIVTGTTILGFSANLTSSLGPIRDFGLIASIGIAFTFLIFGIFMPATKVFLDQQRLKLQIPSFGRSPLGQEGSVLGGILPIGVTIARYIPRLFVIFLIILTAITFSYGAGVDTTFSQEDFLPPEDIPDYLHDLPEPFRPSSYTVTDTLNFLEQNFKTNQQGQVIMYVQGPMRADYALEQIQHASHTPPDSFITRNRRAQSTSIIDVIHAYASQSVAFRQLINRNDADNDGVPDDNLKAIYDALLDSPYRQQA
ncbi:MAG: MMPL family transporter, partial [Halobacteriaceae archaeon]